MQRSFEDLRKGVKNFGKVAKNDGAVLYSKLCEIIVDSEYLLQITDNVPLDQPFTNIILGGVHLLLLKGAEHELASYYATSRLSREQVRLPDSNLAHIFIDFVKQNEAELIQICKTKKVQTNEIGRCSFLLPGLNYLQNLTNTSITLVELGTSAGLLLNYDKYAITYLGIDQSSGDPKSSVQLKCEVKGNKIPPISILPQINKKIGIDIFPINCSTKEEALWLQSLVWPKHLPRFNSLRNALDICRSSNSSFTLIKGDGFRNIEKYLRDYTDKESTFCIYHSFAINQISKVEAEEYYQRLKSYTMETGQVVYELRINWLPKSEHELVLHQISKGKIITTELAKVHHHGRWIKWLVE